MNMVTWSIHRPVPVMVLFVALSLAGIVGFKKLGVQDRPDLDIPTVTVARELSRRAAFAARNGSHAQDRGLGRQRHRHRSHPLDRHRRPFADDHRVPARTRRQRSGRRRARCRHAHPLEPAGRDRRADHFPRHHCRLAGRHVWRVLAGHERGGAVVVRRSHHQSRAVLGRRRRRRQARRRRGSRDPRRPRSGRAQRTRHHGRRHLAPAPPHAGGAAGRRGAHRRSGAKRSHGRHGRLRSRISPRCRSCCRTIAACASTPWRRCATRPRSSAQLALLDGKPIVGFEVTRAVGASALGVADGVAASVEKLRARYPDIQINEVSNTVDYVRESYKDSITCCSRARSSPSSWCGSSCATGAPRIISSHRVAALGAAHVLGAALRVRLHAERDDDAGAVARRRHSRGRRHRGSGEHRSPPAQRQVAHQGRRRGRAGNRSRRRRHVSHAVRGVPACGLHAAASPASSSSSSLSRRSPRCWPRCSSRVCSRR